MSSKTSNNGISFFFDVSPHENKKKENVEDSSFVFSRFFLIYICLIVVLWIMRKLEIDF